MSALSASSRSGCLAMQCRLYSRTYSGCILSSSDITTTAKMDMPGMQQRQCWLTCAHSTGLTRT